MFSASIPNPSDPVAERLLLSAVVFSDEARLLILYGLEDSDFSLAPHVVVFTAMKSLVKRDITPTLEAVIFELQQLGAVAAIESMCEVYNQYLPIPFVEECIEKIRKLSEYRRVLRHALQVPQILDKIDDKTPDKLHKWQDELAKIFCNRVEKKPQWASDILAQAFKDPDRSWYEELQIRQEMARKGSKVLTGYPTHYQDIDKLFDGFQKGHLTIIGARPGVGKTSFMLNLVDRQLTKNNLIPGIFSLEMTALEIVQKMIFIRARQDHRSATRGQINGDQFQECLAAGKSFNERNALFDDTSGITLPVLTNKVKYWVDSFNMNILFIDYLQLIAATDPKKSKYEQITEISQQLKVLAKTANIPIVCLAQLNRGAVATKDTTPRISDLRDSGAIEQDADEIFLLHCPSLENPHEKPGQLQVHIGKNRFGQTGNINLFFEKATGFIGDLAPLEPVKNYHEKEDDYDAPTEKLFRKQPVPKERDDDLYP
jgi:replicative DNA helicase